MLQEYNENLPENEVEEAVPPPDETFAAEEKKPISKFNIFGFFGIVAALVVLCLMHLRGGPSAAAASAVPSAQTNQTITQFLSGGANDVRNMKSSLETTQKQVRTFQNYPSVQQVPLGNLKTNPFAYRGDDKSAEEAARRKAEQDAAIAHAEQALTLQSVMYSSRANGHSACMINGTLCSVGEQVSGFMIAKINPDSVVLVQGTFHFDLKLQK
jgi:hypothetical protein